MKYRDQFWIENYLDPWRKKFSFSLTRKQACEILLDEIKWNKEKNNIEPSMKDVLSYVDSEEYMYKILEEK